MSGAGQSPRGKPLVSPSPETRAQRGNLTWLMSHSKLAADHSPTSAPNPRGRTRDQPYEFTHIFHSVTHSTHLSALGGVALAQHAWKSSWALLSVLHMPHLMGHFILLILIKSLTFLINISFRMKPRFVLIPQDSSAPWLCPPPGLIQELLVQRSHRPLVISQNPSHMAIHKSQET